LREIFDDLNPRKVGHIAEKVTETMLHIALKYLFDHACLSRREASANFGGKVE